MSNSIFPLLASTQLALEAERDHAAAVDAHASIESEPRAETTLRESLSIVLIGPDDTRRQAVAVALRECSLTDIHQMAAYPASADQLLHILEERDTVIIDLDGDADYALRLVEAVSVKWAGTVMVVSAEAGPDKLMRSMRAGAREFLTLPLERSAIDEALGRALTRRPAKQSSRRTAGKLLTFMGAKGGVGVTTLACNFALALTEQPDRTTVLIDLAFPLGDVALSLGLQSEYSSINALQSADRLDPSFLSKLLVKHGSGLAVLAGPGRFVPYEVSGENVEKLLAVARQSFDYVVVDAGSRLDLTEMSLFKDASTIYLIAQVGVAELRNSNRLISQCSAAASPKIEIVLNRHDPHATALPEDYISKVLTKPPRWKIPNDYASVQRMQTDATPLVPGESSISQAIQEMARAVTGQPAPKKKRKAFGLFG